MNNHIIGGGGDSSPFFSIVILSYNKEPYIAKCIESCLNQTYTNFEVIIVDDCSQDKTPSIVQEYVSSNPQILFIQNEQNRGAFASRIIGEQHARGEYIIHVDGDDFFREDMCEILYPFCKTQQYDIIGFGQISINLQNNQTILTPPLGKYSVDKIVLQLGMISRAFKSNIIKKSHYFITSTLFPNKIPHLINLEDGLQSFAIAIFSNTFLGINHPLYYQQTNLQSTTGDCSDILKNYKKNQDFQFSLSMMLEIVQYFDIPSHQKTCLKKQIQKQWLPIMQRYSYIYYHSKAYENKPFAYPINFLKSLRYTKSLKVICKTLTRVLVYFITFGRIKF